MVTSSLVQALWRNPKEEPNGKGADATPVKGNTCSSALIRRMISSRRTQTERAGDRSVLYPAQQSPGREGSGRIDSAATGIGGDAPTAWAAAHPTIARNTKR